PGRGPRRAEAGHRFAARPAARAGGCPTGPGDRRGGTAGLRRRGAAVTRRKVCVVITARPSYSRIKAAMRAIRDRQDLDLQLVVAGSALLERYGTAVRTIENDGFEVSARVPMVLEGGDL